LFVHIFFDINYLPFVYLMLTVSIEQQIYNFLSKNQIFMSNNSML